NSAGTRRPARRLHACAIERTGGPSGTWAELSEYRADRPAARRAGTEYWPQHRFTRRARRDGASGPRDEGSDAILKHISCFYSNPSCHSERSEEFSDPYEAASRILVN